MFWLRILSITAGIFAIIYNYNISATPLWTPIQWNGLFMATNLMHILLLIYNKRQIRFEGHQKFLYEEVFRSFSPVNFKKVLDLGHLRTSPKGFQMLEKGQQMEGLILIVEGEVSIMSDQMELAVLAAGKFVGEMSFLTDEATRASVVAKEEIRYYVWDKEQLQALLMKDAAMNSQFIGALGRQVINQLMRKSISESKPNSDLKLAA